MLATALQPASSCSLGNRIEAMGLRKVVIPSAIAETVDRQKSAAGGVENYLNCPMSPAR